jgi:hypothetical protein
LAALHTKEPGQSLEQDADQLRALGYESHFDRTMSKWENFSLGFTLAAQPGRSLVSQLRDDSDDARGVAKPYAHGNAPAGDAHRVAAAGP